jgi:hypothetical protein
MSEEAIDQIDEINACLSRATAILDLLENERGARATQVFAAASASELIERAKVSANALWELRKATA